MNFLNPDLLAASRTKLLHRALKTDTNQQHMTISERRQFDLGSGEQTNIDEYQRYVLLFNLENWYSQLADITFPTQVLELSRQDGHALKDCYDRIKEHNVHIDESHTFQCYNQLEASIPNCSLENGDGYFVKTSCRSAKDYADLDNLRSVFSQALISISGSGSSPFQSHSENIKMIAMSYASMELLKMRSAKQVLQNFMRSERIWHDMHLALAHSASNWNESIVVRQWVNIEPDMEFRCFVCSGKLTAISQYRHLIYFARLHKNEVYLKHVMTQFLEVTIIAKLQGLFPRDDYVIDLALELNHNDNKNKNTCSCLEEVSLEGQIKKMWAVEVNPFYETTDACMFSWSTDATVLMPPTVTMSGEQDEVERRYEDVDLRIRHSPAMGCSSLIYGAWKNIMDEV